MIKVHIFLARIIRRAVRVVGGACIGKEVWKEIKSWVSRRKKYLTSAMVGNDASC